MTDRISNLLGFSEINKQIQNCRKCPRLVEYRESIASQRKKAYLDWEYWGKPVPGFGDPQGRLLLVGLAPGAHGSNRTGRMFTGDASGVFLYRALHRAGFANQPDSTAINDGLTLQDAFITAVCRCAPPGNRPTPYEIKNCQPFLLAELKFLENLQGIVALGQLAYNRLLHIYQIQPVSAPKFSHGAYIAGCGDQPWILASYHPSRQNTQTGRLTEGMFKAIWDQASKLLK